MFRRRLFCVAFLVATLGAGAAYSSSIVNSDHDLTAIGKSRDHAGVMFNDYGEVCVYCHTPHGADPAVPLWNREMNQGSYTLYSSPTLDAGPLGQPPLGGFTRMCLSCHDGTIAVDALVNMPNRPIEVGSDHMAMEASDSPHGGTCGFCHMWFYEDPPNVDVKPSFITTDLSDDHPVSFAYTAQLASDDGGLELPTAPSGLGGTIADDLLIGGRIECPSCHNVHDPDIFPFLIKDNTNSALCVTCHMK